MQFFACACCLKRIGGFIGDFEEVGLAIALLLHARQPAALVEAAPAVGMQQ